MKRYKNTKVDKQNKFILNCNHLIFRERVGKGKEMNKRCKLNNAHDQCVRNMNQQLPVCDCVLLGIKSDVTLNKKIIHR